MVVVLLAWLAGGYLLAVVGPDYVAAKTLMVLLLIAASFELASASIRAANYAMGRAASLLYIHLLAMAAYLVLFVAFTRAVGLNGPGFASIVSSLLTLVLSIRLVTRSRSTG